MRLPTSVATRRPAIAVGALALALVSIFASAEGDDPASRRIVKDGIAVELRLARPDDPRADLTDVRAGQDAIVEFRVASDANASPRTGLRPAAWIAARRSGDGEESCTQKIRGFLQGSLARRPEIDLNAWHVLALNARGSITVIDPLLQYGGQKIVTLVPLDAPGADWTLSPDRRALFVTVPAARHVAVVDTVGWRRAPDIELGARPRRIARQPDGRFLWVSAEGDRGEGLVIVIDPETRGIVARIATGTGADDIAFTADDRIAFVANRRHSSVTAIDIRTLAPLVELPTGRHPAALAYSPLSHTLLVADEVDGTITVIDADAPRIVARIAAAPGLRALAFSPDGRWALAASARERRVFVVDASTNRVRHVVEAGPTSERIVGTATYAYLRGQGGDTVDLIPWSDLGKDAPIGVKTITGGQGALAAGATPGGGSVIATTPEPNAVLIGNPGDAMIYYYTEGMNAPMGSFNNMRREMTAVLAVDRSLAEGPAGRYSGAVRLPAGGSYDVAFLLDQPRIAHCFRVEVDGERADAAAPPRKAERLQFLTERRRVDAGEPADVQFRLRHPQTGEIVADVRDLRVLAIQTAGNWQRREAAAPLGDGVYGVSLRLPAAGTYRIYVESRSLGLRVTDLPYLVVHATPPEAARGSP